MILRGGENRAVGATMVLWSTSFDICEKKPGLIRRIFVLGGLWCRSAATIGFLLLAPSFPSILGCSLVVEVGNGIEWTGGPDLLTEPSEDRFSPAKAFGTCER